MDLVAISPATRTVALGRAAVEVTGLSLRKLTNLIVEYPHLVPLAAGGEVDLGRLLIEAPDTALAVFAVGVVGPGRPRSWRLWRRPDEMAVPDNARLLAAFDQAATGQQLDCLAVIVDLTFKGERAVPFLKMIFGARAKPEPELTPPEPTPPPSDGSSGSDTTQTTPGT